MATKTQIAELTIAQTTELYNQLVAEDRQVRKFPNKAEAHKRLAVALRQARKIVVATETGPGLADQPETQPRTELTDDCRITLLVEENPKRVGSKTHARFALYKTGMTVGQFLDACVAHDGPTARPRHRYLADLHWDRDHQFLTVEK
jgi:hypothetical protein